MEISAEAILSSGFRKGEVVSAGLALSATLITDVALGDENRPVFVDATQFHETIKNLATNAVHAMGVKGTLSISVW